jgi:hypothetical protein
MRGGPRRITRWAFRPSEAHIGAIRDAAAVTWSRAGSTRRTSLCGLGATADITAKSSEVLGLRQARP